MCDDYKNSDRHTYNRTIRAAKNVKVHIFCFLTLVLTNESHLIFTKFAHYHVHKLTADWQQTVKLTLIGLAVHQIHVLSRYLLFTEP